MKKLLKYISRIIPNKVYLKIKYYIKLNKKLNIKNPQTFNEKLQWLKLYDHRSIYTTMVDKYEAKRYVSSIIGDEYIIPTFGIYNSFDEIDFDKLPNEFVIKCTHDSGGLVIVDNKSNIDKKKLKKVINKSLKQNYYYSGREWQYKNVKPRIIIEKYMGSKDNKGIRDYKFFCFDGIPKIMYISDESHTDNQKIAFFDMDYNLLDIKRKDYKDYDIIPEKPKTFEKMKEFATVLSKGFPHIRVDFYEINGSIYFGELTLTTGSGFIPFEDNKWDIKLGEYIKLPNK